MMFLLTFDRTEFPTRIILRYQSGGPLAPICDGVHGRHETLTPVTINPGKGDPLERSEVAGAALCERCCMEPDSRGGWYGLTDAEMRRLWAMVREHLAREVAA